MLPLLALSAGYMGPTPLSKLGLSNVAMNAAEEAAKRAWLAKLDAPSWGPTSSPVAAPAEVPKPFVPKAEVPAVVYEAPVPVGLYDTRIPENWGRHHVY